MHKELWYDCQFHQYFTSSFLIPKFFAQFLSDRHWQLMHPNERLKLAISYLSLFAWKGLMARTTLHIIPVFPGFFRFFPGFFRGFRFFLVLPKKEINCFHFLCPKNTKRPWKLIWNRKSCSTQNESHSFTAKPLKCSNLAGSWNTDIKLIDFFLPDTKMYLAFFGATKLVMLFHINKRFMKWIGQGLGTLLKKKLRFFN